MLALYMTMHVLQKRKCKHFVEVDDEYFFPYSLKIIPLESLIDASLLRYSPCTLLKILLWTEGLYLSSNTYIEILTPAPKVMVLGSKGFGRELGLDG